LADSGTSWCPASFWGRGRSSSSVGNRCRVPHHLLRPPPCQYTTTPGHRALRPGRLHTCYIGLLAESSLFCYSLPPPPSQGMGRRGAAHRFLYASGINRRVSVCDCHHNGACGRGTGQQRSTNRGWQVSTGDGGMAVGRHDRGAVRICWAAGAAWRMAAAGAVGGLHHSGDGRIALVMADRSSGRRGLMGGCGGQALIGTSLSVLWLAV
jgi:hypothetical protein